MNSRTGLYAFNMAIQNLKSRKNRSILMCLFVLIMTATFFFSTYITENLESRIEKTTNRLGADMIVVAAGAEWRDNGITETHRKYLNSLCL